jgi:prepilin-type N-terminal cleavage/methylation domain-containing protein
MKTEHRKRKGGQVPKHLQSGMTLAEVVVALAITGLSVAGIINGYTFCTNSAQRSALSLAASARALERIEETRSALWDTIVWTNVDRVVSGNFSNKVVALDLTGSGKQSVLATLKTTISTIPSPAPLKRIRVDCIWRFKGVFMTNTVETCRAPDQ